jgi:hypothetical protein
MGDKLPISGPLGLGDLLDRAFRLYRARFGTLLLTAALFIVPLGLLTGAVTGWSMTNFMDALGGVLVDPEAPPDEFFRQFGSVFGGLYGSSLLLGLLGFVVNSIVQLALLYQSNAVLNDQKASLGEGLRGGLSRFWAFVGMQIVEVLGFIVATVAILLPIVCVLAAVFVAGVFAFPAPGESSGAGDLAAGIGFALLFICGYLFALAIIFLPTLYLSARWIVALPGLIVQRWGPVEALRESWRLTAGHVWRAIGYTVLLFLLSFLVTGLPVALIQQVLFFLMPDSMRLAAGVSSALASIASVVWQPIYVAAILLLYYDLRVRKESYDLALQIERLESEVGGREDGADAERRGGE